MNTPTETAVETPTEATIQLTTGRTQILVVAATARELAPANGWLTLQCGVGPVEAAAATAAAIAAHWPLAILHVGIAGTRRGSTLTPPAIVIGRASVYCDVSADSTWTPRIVSASPLLLAALQRAFPAIAVRAIGTTARVGGTSNRPVDFDAGIDAATDVEAMEGFGVLRAAQLAGIPAVEVRAISNDIEEADRARWHFDEAFAAIITITPMLVATLQDALQHANVGCATDTTLDPMFAATDDAIADDPNA